jgi:hypothetical protein
MPTHPVELEMGLIASEILDVIYRSDRCYQAVRGFVAEYHLEKILTALVAAGQLESYARINKDGKPDFRIFVDAREVTIECKNVKSGDLYADGDAKVDFQRTRNQVGEKARTGRFYSPGEFDVLAAAEHTKDGIWSFKFVRTADLPRVTVEGLDLFKKVVRVPKSLDGTTPWRNNLMAVLRFGPEPARMPMINLTQV